MKKRQESKSIFLKYAIQKAGSEFVNLRKDVVLDFNLNISDLAVYIAILVESCPYGGYRDISFDLLEVMTGIKFNNLNRSTNKLLKYGYIKTLKKKGTKTKYAIDKIDTESKISFIPISTDGIHYPLHKAKKDFIEKLRVMFLLNGSSELPSFAKCKLKNISFYKYGFLKKMLLKITAFEKYDFTDYEETELDFDTIEALKNCNSVKCYKSLFIETPLLKPCLNAEVEGNDFIESFAEI